MGCSAYPYNQSITMTYQMKNDIKVQATKEGIPQSELIRKMVSYYLNEVKLWGSSDEPI